MTLIEATKTCFRKYATFSGRATRSEFWKFILFMFLSIVALVIINSLIFGPEVGYRVALDAEGNPRGEPMRSVRYNEGWLGDVFFLVTLLPWLAVSWRRMHDSGRAGYLPFASWAVMLAVFSGFIVFSMGPSEFWTAIRTTGQATVNSTAGAVLFFIGFIGVFVLNIYWLTRPSDPHTNRYGPNPTEVTP